MHRSAFRRSTLLQTFVLIVLCGACGARGQAAGSSPVIGPLKDGWEIIDQRFIFLTVELSSVEASINAVNKALVAAGRDQSKAEQRAENYAAGNIQMDRLGGGPMDWQAFYGKTAASFYYHSSASIDVQGQSNFQLHAQAQGKDLTAIGRPPELDYIYRANTDARQHAETDAATLGNQIDRLLSRRRELESEQSSLWCKIALRGLTTRDLQVRPLYRYDLPTSPADQQSTQRYAAIFAECKFMRTINLLVKQAQSALDGEQATVYDQLQKVVSSCREDLSSSLLNLPILANGLADPQSYLGQFDAASRRLNDLSQNLVDAYRLAGDGDQTNDDQRKDSFRGQFQQTIMDFAATALTADAALTAEAAEWNITPDRSRLVAMDSNAKPLIVPAALHAPGAAQLSTSPSVQQAIGDLEDAKKAYGEAIDAAKTRLAAAYGAAILAATQRGDLDAAMALRRERDSLAANELNHGARDPDVKVEDGWTILFRSNDPLLFNAPVLNATSYSVAVSCAPPTTRWLRVKRMDTSQYVIVPMTAEGILKNGDTSEPFWWRGDKKLSACACNVGIVDQSMPTAGPTLQAMEPNGNFAGWGFGETVQGDRQGYVWARVTIPRTVFEIAVTDRDLSPEEEGQLLKAN